MNFRTINSIYIKKNTQVSKIAIKVIEPRLHVDAKVPIMNKATEIGCYR